MRTWVFLATAPDAPTWGITGPLFLAMTWGVFAVIVLAHFVRIRPWPDRGEPLILTPEMVAFAMGGRDQAVLTAVGALVDRGDLRSAGPQVAVAPGCTPSTPLERAIVDSVDRGRTTRRLRSAPAVRRSLQDLQDHLASAGLAPPPSHRPIQRGLSVAVGVVWVVAVIRLLAGLANGRPVGFLLLTLFALPLIWRGVISMRNASLQRRSRAAGVRESHKRLAKEAASSARRRSRTLPLDNGLSVAVEPSLRYAVGAPSRLRQRDPALFHSLGLATAPLAASAASAGASYGFWGGGSDSGGSSCGGGGGCGG